MYYLRARYYNPLTGRFLSVDPQAGQGQRRYEYAGADPVDGLDPSGNEAIIEWALLQFYPKRLPIFFPGFPSWCGFEMGGFLPGCGGGSGGDGGGTGAGPGAPGGPPSPPPPPCRYDGEQSLSYNPPDGNRYPVWLIQWQLARPSKCGGEVIQHIARVDMNRATRHYNYWEAWYVPPGATIPATVNGGDEWSSSGGKTHISGSAVFYEHVNDADLTLIGFRQGIYNPKTRPAGGLLATPTDPGPLLPLPVTTPVNRDWKSQ
jgi:hypothetical protein